MDTMTEVTQQVSKGASEREGKYLGFILADEGYGIPIIKVQEIIGMMAITKVPKMPDFVKGVINLRGTVVPVIDLRLKFQMDAVDYSDRTCIIVVEMQKEDTTVLSGVIVDAVTEVMNINAENVEDTPQFGTKLDTSFIRGMAKLDSGVKILLDIDRILTTTEIKVLETAG